MAEEAASERAAAAAVGEEVLEFLSLASGLDNQDPCSASMAGTWEAEAAAEEERCRDARSHDCSRTFVVVCEDLAQSLGDRVLKHAAGSLHKPFAQPFGVVRAED